MLVLFLFVFVGLTNLCMGCALAVVFGYAPASPADAWTALFSRSPAAPRASEESEVSEESIAALLSLPLPASVPREVPVETRVEASAEPVAQPEPEPVVEAASPAVAFGNVEDTVLDMNAAIERGEAKIAEIETMLRDCYDEYDRATLLHGMQALATSCQEYLKEQSSSIEQFDKRVGELSELAALADQIEMANLELSAQIETTISRFESLDYVSDLPGTGGQLLAEIDKTRNVWHRIRDERAGAFLAIARHEGRLDQIRPQRKSDPLTALPNRLGVEVALEQCWSDGQRDRHALHGVLIDLDRFAALNREHGGTVGNAVLQHVGRYLRDAVSEQDLVGRLTGQQFFVLITGHDAEQAIRRAEVLRQSIARITFAHNLDKIQVTATCVLGAPLPDETPVAFLDRLRHAVKQAQQHHRNEVCRHDGQSFQAVPPAEIETEEREILI